MPDADFAAKQIIALVVDDSEAVRQFVTMQLEKHGCLVFSASNGEEAVRLATKGFLDLVLMDLYMPLVDGWEATRQIRQTERDRNRPPTYIIGISAAPDREQCLAAGMNEVIEKPLTPEELTRVFHSVRSAAPMPTVEQTS